MLIVKEIRGITRINKTGTFKKLMVRLGKS